MTLVLFLTQSNVADYSFGGAQRANHLRNALLSVAEVDTLIIHGGPRFLLEEQWSSGRTRGANISAYGVSVSALRQRFALTRWIDSILSERAYDYVVAQYVDLATLVPRHARKMMIFDPDDFLKSMPSGIKGSMLTRAKLRVRNVLAQRIASQALHVWFANPRLGHVPNNQQRSFMPNVVSIPDDSRRRPAVVPQRLLMVGFFDHAPNAEGLTWFVANVWPSIFEKFPAAELHVVGQFNGNIAAHLPSVCFRGYVEDLTLEYDRAAVVIAPIRSGGGTQIKVIDALVHGRPLVSSMFAYAGFAEDLTSGESLLTAESVSDWIVACDLLLSDRSAAEAMAAHGAREVKRSYGRDRMKREVTDTLTSLSNRRAAALEIHSRCLRRADIG